MDMDFGMFQSMIEGQGRNNNVFARFYDKAVKTDELNDNGLPKFKNVTYVEIRTRDNLDVFDQPARDEHKNRFPQEYARYLLEQKQKENGTPLNNFAFLTVEQLETCKFYGIFTVEVLAGIDDEKANAINIIAERDIAKQFMDNAKATKGVSDWAKKEKEYKAKIKKLEDEIKALKEGKNE
ncbi:MAG: hypothetical protein KBT03_13780 [Bacteroidales bacterium]|nr:hypothetical protein [Candidatus Scybalousia scybalohippi]